MTDFAQLPPATPVMNSAPDMSLTQTPAALQQVPAPVTVVSPAPSPPSSDETLELLNKILASTSVAPVEQLFVLKPVIGLCTLATLFPETKHN